jgi:hypothetical protein
MFTKREEIDEIELGANLYLKGLKASKQALVIQNIMVETPQEPIILLKTSSEDILERAKEEPKESRQDLAKQNIIKEIPQEPKAPLKNPFEDILERAKRLVI